MIIDVKNNSIFISNLSSKNARNIKLQLSGYGFIKNPDSSYSLNHSEPMHILMMLFDYMNTNQLKYQLTDNAQAFIDRNQFF